jgi:GNAT superfamily N-acetyltransferase
MAATIAPIKPDEISALLEMIVELARFEHLEHEVEVTEVSLRKALSGEPPAAGALIARENGQIAGYAIYFFTFCSFAGRRGMWLEDVYVRPPFRRRGLGTNLIKAVAKIAADNNCGRFEWAALKWNKTALDVYQKMGANIMEEWVMLRVQAEGIHKLAVSEPGCPAG